MDTIEFRHTGWLWISSQRTVQRYLEIHFSNSNWCVICPYLLGFDFELENVKWIVIKLDVWKVSCVE